MSSDEERASGEAEDVDGASPLSILHVLGQASTVSIPYELARRQREHGHSVHVASVLVPLDGAAEDPELTVVGRGSAMVRSLARLVTERFDIVHVHHGSASLVGALLARMRRVPVVVTEHRAEGVNRPLQLARGSLASSVVCNSEFTQSTMPWPLGGRSKVVVVHNGVDVAAVRAGSADRWREIWHRDLPTILCVGRLIGDKGQASLVRAMAATSEPCALALVGDGPDRDQLAKLADELLISDRVVHLGRQPRHTVYDAMAGAAVVVVPSRTEGFCNVAAEALAAGVPLIATTAGALPEVLEGSRASQVEIGDWRSIAERIDEAVRSPHRNDPDDRFSLDRAIQEHDRIYRSVRRQVSSTTG